MIRELDAIKKLNAACSGEEAVLAICVFVVHNAVIWRMRCLDNFTGLPLRALPPRSISSSVSPLESVPRINVSVRRRARTEA
jgi:hypothetical protein